MKDYEELSKQHFNQQAPIYDQTNTNLYSKVPKISCADVENRLKNLKYSKLLDIGCGTGYLIDKLKLNSDAKFYGLDISPEMLKVAKKKLGDSVNFTEGSGCDLPYDNNVFDVVTCIQSFHHYPDPKKAMEEAYRVTSKGGRYLVSDTSYGIFNWLANHFFIPFLSMGDVAVYGTKDIEKMMKQAGYKIESSEKITKSLYSIYTVVGIKE